MKTRFRMPPSDDDLDLLRFHLAGAADSALAAYLLVCPLADAELWIEMIEAVTGRDVGYRGLAEQVRIKLDAIRLMVSPEAWLRILDYEVAQTERAERLATLTFRLGLSARVGHDET